MNAEASVHRRIARRETHSPRAGAAITVAVVLILVAAAVAVGCVLLIVDPAALAGVRSALGDAVGFTGVADPGAMAAAIAAMVIGVVLVVLAIAPGRRARRRLQSQRAAVIVDDKAIARTLATVAAENAGLPRDRVRVVVHRRRAAVQITPTAGVAVDSQALTELIARAGAAYELDRPPRVVVTEKAVVG